MEIHRLALAPGYQIEHFRIEGVLGKGGFGITYIALDLKLGKRVAIKELLPDSIATRVDGSTVVPHSDSLQESWTWARERFLDEARVLAGFSHPAIVGVHNLIEANGTVYMVMDYVDGESYEARLRRIGCEPDQKSLMAIIGPILDGLSEVHEKGLLHRDIKPENILINRRGKPVLIDFGSARSAVGATMTMTSIVTHGYSPAEQYQTKGKMGPWTDIYALGAVMCRAIIGEKPPVASDRLMEDDFQWLSYRLVSGFSVQFLQSMDWALRVRPEERPKSILEWTASFGGRVSTTSSVMLTEQTSVPLMRSSEPDSASSFFIPNHKSPKVLLMAVIGIVLIVSFFAAVMFIQARESEKRGEAVSAEIARAEAARAEALRAEAAKAEAAKAEAAKAEAAKAEAAKAEAAKAEAAKAEAAKAEAAKAEAAKNATKESPFENSLGMKFVPVPGTNVLFSIWDTRVKDFDTYTKATGYQQKGGISVRDGMKWRLDANASWEKPGFAQTDFHPVVGISWHEANSFCSWLTDKEQVEGRIGKNQRYRLPTDAEWSIAVGGGRYPWGNEWPPPKGAGNYDPSLRVDIYVNTSACGKFKANAFGLFDMGGNVWQWCEDSYQASMNEKAMLQKFPYLEDDGGGQKFCVMRGGSWTTDVAEALLSSSHESDRPIDRLSNCGFRCVLEMQTAPNGRNP